MCEFLAGVYIEENAVVRILAMRWSNVNCHFRSVLQGRPVLNHESWRGKTPDHAPSRSDKVQRLAG